MNDVSYSRTIVLRTDLGVAIPDEMEYRQLLPHLPSIQNASVLEIGAGVGDFLLFLRQHGYNNVVGVERDHAAADAARIRGLDNVICTDAIEYIEAVPEDSLDAVIMNNVLEHFPKEVLLSLIPSIRTKLRSGGRFIAKTGNIENPLNIGLYLRDFTHEIGFTRNSLRQLMLLAGFEPEAVAVYDIRYRARNLLRTILVRFIGGSVSWVIRILAKLMACRIDSMSRLIFSVAQKP